MASTRTRISGEERREAILQAVVPVFARYGFHGATTKRLAEAAGVSEALLYRHFPSKEALFEAIGRQHIADEEAHPGFDRILAMAPGTARLIALVQYLIAHVFETTGDGTFPRLIGQSMLSDGQLARTVLNRILSELRPFLFASIEGAEQAGDLVPDVRPGEAEQWALQFLTFGMRMHRLPDPPLGPNDTDRAEMLDRTVRFALRGFGLTPAAIERDYDPDLWTELRIGSRT